MKPGDMVRLEKSMSTESMRGGAPTGIIVEKWGVDNPDWWVVLVAGEMIQWPAGQLSLVEDGELGK